MFSGAYDYTARQWNIDQGTLVNTFNEHVSYTLAITIHDGSLYTGSTDGTIKKWDVTLGPYNGTNVAVNGTAGINTTVGKNSALMAGISTLFSSFVCGMIYTFN